MLALGAPVTGRLADPQVCQAAGPSRYRETACDRRRGLAVSAGLAALAAQVAPEV